MTNITAERKMARMNHTAGKEISASLYNVILGLTVLYGIFVNIVLCHYFTKEAIALVLRMNVLFLIAYFVLAILGGWISYKSDNPFISFLGYNLIVLPMGIVVCVCVGTSYAGIVMEAFKITATIVVIMIAASCIFPKLFLSLGRALFVSLVALLAVSLVFHFLGITNVMLSYIGAGIFSLYIGYDLQKAQLYPKTVDNAVDSAIDVYLDIINLFLRILTILENKNND